MYMSAPDFEKIFQSCGGCYLILLPDAPVFTIVAVTDAYLSATHTKRDAIVGRGLFEVFPDNPHDHTADGVTNLRASLERVMSSKEIDYMKIQKYDVQIADMPGKFEERYWIPDNAPILDEHGAVQYIVHHVEDATSQEHLIHQFGGDDIFKGDEAELNQVERLNKIMVARELRMIELKKELAAYKTRVA
jgi:hypothetical protein